MEEQHHRRKPGHDVDLVQYVGLIRRCDRKAEHIAEPRGENDEPDERPDQRSSQPPALAQRPQKFPPGNAGKSADVNHDSATSAVSERNASGRFSFWAMPSSPWRLPAQIKFPRCSRRTV